MPALMCVPPVNVLFPVGISVPLPSLVTARCHDDRADCQTVIAVEDEPPVIGDVAGAGAVAPPAPICRMPLAMVVTPE